MTKRVTAEGPKLKDLLEAEQKRFAEELKKKERIRVLAPRHVSRVSN